MWPKDIAKMTQFGIAESAWVVWTVLNATNDRAPKQRRNTYAKRRGSSVNYLAYT